VFGKLGENAFKAPVPAAACTPLATAVDSLFCSAASNLLTALADALLHQFLLIGSFHQFANALMNKCLW
jgi:hypothetical protein